MRAANTARTALATLLRLGLLALGLALAAGSATSTRGPAGASGPPPVQPMDPAMAVGVYKSTFGPVKIELDDQGQPGAVHGVWAYDRDGEEVLGYFFGTLDGNILRFEWEERPAPTPAPLRGQGYIVFEASGGSFYGRWWTERRDQGGEWTGDRYQGADPPPAPGPAEQAPPPAPAPTTFTRR